MTQRRGAATIISGMILSLLFLIPPVSAAETAKTELGGELGLGYTTQTPPGELMTPYGVQPVESLKLRLKFTADTWSLLLEPFYATDQTEVDLAGELAVHAGLADFYLWDNRPVSNGYRSDPFGLFTVPAWDTKAAYQARLNMGTGTERTTLDTVRYQDPVDGANSLTLISQMGNLPGTLGIAARLDDEKNRKALVFMGSQLGQTKWTVGAGTSYLNDRFSPGIGVYGLVTDTSGAWVGTQKVYYDDAFDYRYDPYADAVVGYRRWGFNSTLSYRPGTITFTNGLNYENRLGTSHTRGDAAAPGAVDTQAVGETFTVAKGISTTIFGGNVTMDTTAHDTYTLSVEERLRMMDGKLNINFLVRQLQDGDGGFTAFWESYTQPVIPPLDQGLSFYVMPESDKYLMGSVRGTWKALGMLFDMGYSYYDFGVGESLGRLSLKAEQNLGQTAVLGFEAGRDTWNLDQAARSLLTDDSYHPVPGQIDNGTPVYLKTYLTLKF